MFKVKKYPNLKILKTNSFKISHKKNIKKNPNKRNFSNSMKNIKSKFNKKKNFLRKNPKKKFGKKTFFLKNNYISKSRVNKKFHIFEGNKNHTGKIIKKIRIF